MADAPALLAAVRSFGASVERQGAIPEPAASVLSSHALIAVILAALQDAGRLDEIPASALKERLARALTTGNPDDEYLLPLLDRADELVQYIQDRTHRQYVDAGAEAIRTPYPSLKQIIAEPPAYLDDYVDFVERLRANPSVARELLQTAELLCFDAALGDEAWRAPAFDHLMTMEHHGLLAVAVRCLRSVAGSQVANYLDEVTSFRNKREAPTFVDRRIAPSPLRLQPREESEPTDHVQRRTQEPGPEQPALMGMEDLAEQEDG
ncbi:hypothetical protein [Arthrobacter sp. CAN_A1]|uniref:hypothetical protein n=1 Tax=Arthrobacter sp. CAN_A1 TaxID=2787717 RepID=UPI0018CBBDA3